MTEAWKQWEGQVVNGEFRLLQYLGGGEHSAVFVAEYGEREPHKAAIKLIPADPGSAEHQLSRWRLAAQLSHPHLVRLLQMGRCQLGNMELLYVVMEYAQEDLSQILPHRPLTPTEARDMLKPVLDALAYIHGKGFVHGHMKPANIMALNDQIKVSSDGLCRMGESSGGLGKPSVYDPPEAGSGAISSAGDVWSLGMTLVEALTQRLPVWETTEQGEPILPETMPAAFLDIARYCLRPNPQRRWTVADIAAWLQQTSPVPQKRTPPAEPTARPVPQRQAISRKDDSAKWRYIVATVAGGLALAAMLAGSRLLNRRPEAQRAPSIASEQPRVPPKSERGPATRESGKSTPRAGDDKQGLSGAAPSPTPLRSGEGAKTSTRGTVPGEVFQKVLPNVPQKARDTIRGTVRVGVRVRVDPSGSVAGATLDSPGASKYFANLALQAARRWEFGPAKVDGRYVPSEWILRFEFTKTATKVFPVQAAP
jgi:TonB family protein